MASDEQGMEAQSSSHQMVSHPLPPPTDMVIQRLFKLGIPADYLERKEAGLVQYIKDNKRRSQDVIAALLPGPEEMQATSAYSCATDEATWTPVLPAFKQQCREGIRWVQWLMFEGDPEVTLEGIRGLTGGQRGVCGAVWGNNDIAYRCRTCENDPTCAICVPCFRAGNHANHDYSMIHTGGGCCDCGDITAWKPSGFCSKHRGPGQVPPLPEAFTTTVYPVLETLLIEWARRLRAAEKVADRKPKKWDDQMVEEKVASKTTAAMVEMLLAFCNCSESMLTFAAGLVGSNKVGLLDTLLQTECFLPKKIVATLHELLFKLMGDLNFKYQFAKAFIGQYPRFIRDGIHENLESTTPNHGNSRFKENPTLSSFSVQIFTVPSLTPQLVVELRLLDMLLETMKELFLNCAGDDGRIMVSKGPIANSLYYRVLEDIRFVMSHVEVAQYIARERPDLSRAWLCLLAYTQGMDPQRRVTSIHVEEESESWISAYCLELQMASIHPFYVTGAATVDHLNRIDGNLSQQMDVCIGKEPEDDAVVGRHAKIGRTSKDSDVVGVAGTSSGMTDTEMDIRGTGSQHFDVECTHTDKPSIAVMGVDGSSGLKVPTALLWLIYECIKVLDTWLAVDASQYAAKSKRSIIEPGEGVQRRGIHWRGRGGRGLARDSHGPTTDDSANATVDTEGSPRRSTIREWLRRSRRTTVAESRAAQNAVGEPVTRTVNVEDASQMDTDMPLCVTDQEQGGVLDNGGLGSIVSMDWWMGTEVMDAGIGLGFPYSDKDWLAVDFDVSRQEVSFHIPLHRMLALLLQKSIDMLAAEFQKHELSDSMRTSLCNGRLLGQTFIMQLLPPGYQAASFSSILMEHPLRLQVFCAQVRAGMWRRNGHSVLTLCDYYHSVRWCEDSLDLDLFLLQCCGVMAPAEEFVERIQTRFGLADYFSLYLSCPNEYEPTLVQDMLALIIRIVSERGFCGFSTVQALRRELIWRLAISDAPRSLLIKSLPPRLSDDKHLQDTLDSVATYCNPSGMQQGKYSLRRECWGELDLYHPRYTRRDLQSAEDRYMRACGTSAVLKQLPRWRKPYAPLLSLSRIATSRKVHDILRSIFFHAAFSERISESCAPEGVLITALHLLALALDICALSSHKEGMAHSHAREPNDSCFEFSTSDCALDAQEAPPLLAQATQRVYVGAAEGHSLLSLLVILMRRYGSNNVQGITIEANQCNIGDLIRNLLGKFADLHRGCMYEIESLAPELLHRVSTGSIDKGSEFEVKKKDQQIQLSEAERRKALARERQAAVMAKMKAAQEKFVAGLHPSDEGNDPKGISHKNELDQKTTKDLTMDSEEFSQESMAVICALCRDTGSKNPTSFLTLVQRSRLIAIAEKGMPSWDKGMPPRDEGVLHIERKGMDSGSGSGDIGNHDSQNTDELWNWLQMVLSGDMGGERSLEVEAFLDFLRVELPGNFEIAHRIAGGAAADVRMSESTSLEGGSDDSTGEDNTDSNIDSATDLLSDPSRFNQQQDPIDEKSKTREKTIIAVVVEYFKLLSRNVKEQQQRGDSEASSVAAGPQNRRASTLRSTTPSGIVSMPLDSIGSNDSIGVHISSCGHAVHQECLDRYLSSLLQRYYSRTLFEGLQIVDPDQGEFLCPVCRRLANSVLPVLRGNFSTSSSCTAQVAAGMNGLSSSCLSGVIGSTSPVEGCPSISTKSLQLQQALFLLHDAEELVWKPGFRKAVSKPLPKSSKAVLDSLFSRLCGLYFSDKENANKPIQGRLSQSLLLWDVLRYTVMSAEVATRTRKPKVLFFEPENRLDILWRAADTSKGSILPLLLQAAKDTQSLNRQAVLLRARGMQLFVGSICYGVSKDSISETFTSGSISKLLQVADYTKGRDAPDVQFWRRTADPVLAHDPFSSLIWLVFCLPLSFPSSTEPFISLVHLLYLVCVTQAIAFMGTSLTSATQFSHTTQAFVQTVFSTLKDTSLCLLSDEYTSMIPSGSPLVVIRQLTLPYLRRCALLQKLLFYVSSDLPLEEETVWEKLTPDTNGAAVHIIDSESTQPSPDVLEELRELDELEKMFFLPPLQALLEDGNSQEVSLKWCQHFLRVTKSRKFQHVPRPSPAVPFKLMTLPILYQDLIQRYIKERCPVCSTVPDQPALCLLCGALCCAVSRRPCCSTNRQSECYRHAMTCGAGVGVFLMIRKTNILLQRCARQASWPSPYLDAFGEEDIEMVRGKPLYLSEERYADLTAMVASHSLDHCSLVLYHTTRETVFWG